jgi:hypothetical protein
LEGGGGNSCKAGLRHLIMYKMYYVVNKNAFLNGKYPHFTETFCLLF